MAKHPDRAHGSGTSAPAGCRGEPAWRAERRARIVDATMLLLRDRDPAGLNMDAVAVQAGVGKATLYRYYPSKDALLMAAFGAGLGALATRLESCAGVDDPMERLLRMIDEIMSVTGEQLAFLKMSGDRQHELTQQWRHLFRHHRAPIVGALREALAAGVAAGRLRPVDLDVVPSMMVGIVRGVLASDLMAGSRGRAEAGLSRARVAASLRSFIIAALAVGDGAAGPGCRP